MTWFGVTWTRLLKTFSFGTGNNISVYRYPFSLSIIFLHIFEDDKAETTKANLKKCWWWAVLGSSHEPFWRHDSPTVCANWKSKNANWLFFTTRPFSQDVRKCKLESEALPPIYWGKHMLQIFRKNGKMATFFWFPSVWFMTSSRKNPSILYTVFPPILPKKKRGHRQPWFDCLIQLEVSYLTIAALDMAPVCSLKFAILSEKKTWHEKQHRLGSSMGWF